LADTQRSKVHFIHLNHTNPALAPESPAAKAIRAAGMYVAEQGTRYSL
jgi:pyrroloquinoline quinone biosynthesis protein B